MTIYIGWVLLNISSEARRQNNNCVGVAQPRHRKIYNCKHKNNKCRRRNNKCVGVVVMTSNLNDIYEQTLERIKGALNSFQVFGKAEISQTSKATHGLPLALVCPKAPRRLRDALNIVQLSNWQNQPVIIIDDEADQASLDTNINDQNKPTSSVNRAIVDLRTFFWLFWVDMRSHLRVKA
ncbi:hypothetical protein LC608_01115 [Nostoc sp. XA010]|uniref:hypothetical protein n=1 Tax=Nostoc sp. XA010 TaxID=2780407 RepID=UPI001E451B84|nr:hypothetical protein [Nostoc sp. XA010]MCC5655612.1 hypothetical protein [Nostoc sp. XA010]